MIPTLFHKRKYLKESIENTCKSLSRHCNFDARNLKKRTNMMEKVTQMIAMLIKAWKKESVSQIDTPPVPATPEPKQQSPNNSACLTERVNTFLQTHYDLRRIRGRGIRYERASEVLQRKRRSTIYTAKKRQLYRNEAGQSRRLCQPSG